MSEHPKDSTPSGHTHSLPGSHTSQTAERSDAIPDVPAIGTVPLDEPVVRPGVLPKDTGSSAGGGEPQGARGTSRFSKALGALSFLSKDTRQDASASSQPSVLPSQIGPSKPEDLKTASSPSARHGSARSGDPTTLSGKTGEGDSELPSTKRPGM